MAPSKSLRMAQRHAIFEQLRKKRTPAVIHRNLKRVYGRSALTLHAVMYQRKRHEQGKGPEDSARSGRPRIEGLELVIVDESVTADHVSVQKLKPELRASERTILRRMHELGGEYLPVQRQPHVLKQSDKDRRVVLAGQLHKHLLAKNTWPRIITGDEAWIYLRNYNTAEWVFPWGRRSARTEPGVVDLKIMLTVFWSTSGFHLVHFASSETRIDSEFICQRLRDLRAALPEPHAGKLFIHVDNAPSHRAKITQTAIHDLGFTALPHPPYSPDLAPSDFYLFGYLKGAIRGKIFSSIEELQDDILAKISLISQKTLRKVYNEWISRLERCTCGGGEYVHISG